MNSIDTGFPFAQSHITPRSFGHFCSNVQLTGKKTSLGVPRAAEKGDYSASIARTFFTSKSKSSRDPRCGATSIAKMAAVLGIIVQTHVYICIYVRRVSRVEEFPRKIHAVRTFTRMWTTIRMDHDPEMTRRIVFARTDTPGRRTGRDRERKHEERDKKLPLRRDEMRQMDR